MSSTLTISRRALLAGSLVGLAGALAHAQEPFTPHGPVTPTPLGPDIPPELIRYAADWPVAQGNLAATRTAVSAPLTIDQASRLALVWRFPIDAQGGYGGMTATPLIAGETVYLQDMASNVFALDRATGRLRWERHYDVPSIGPNGVALGYGRVFGATGNTAEVFALDAATGREFWRVELSNHPFEGIDMAPAVYAGTVYISTVAGNTTGFNRGGTRGILYALEAASGRTLWQFDTTTDNLWGSPRLNSGGGLWYPPAIDERGNLYFGVANAAPWPGTADYPNGVSRPGANDYAGSMVSLDPTTGAVRWHHNAAPHDLFDHDFQNTPVLTTAVIDGRARALAVGSGKTGTVVAVDRDTGAVIWRTAVGLHSNDELTEIPPGTSIEVAPGAWGGVPTPIAVAAGSVYVPVVDQPTRYTSTGVDRASMFDFARGRGRLVALDLVDGAVQWETLLPTPAFGAATVAGDIVFTGGPDGRFRAFARATGEEVWRYDADAGINAPPAIAGDLVVLPVAGPLIRPGERSRAPNAEVLAFRAEPGVA